LSKVCAGQEEKQSEEDDSTIHWYQLARVR
jgi:hypothetical protein